MALSGSIKTNSYDGRYYTLSWTATQSIANNTSTISWKITCAGGDDSWYAERTVKAVINGTTVFSKSERVERYAGTVKSGTLTINHAADGSKSFSASLQVACYTVAVNLNASGSFTLNTIPRKSSLSAGNGTLGTAQTLTVAKQADAFTHTITYKCGSVSGTVCTKSSSKSISFTPPLSLAGQNTTGTSVSITFTIETFNGSTSVGTNAKTITCSIPASVKPSCSVAVTDAMGYADTYGGYIKGLSKFKVVVTPQTSYDSPIASHKTTANGSTYTAASFTTDVLKSAGTLTVSATVTDKRGRSGSASKSLAVLDYATPIIRKLTVKRCNEDGVENDQGAFVQVTFSAAVTGLSGKNTAAYTLKYQAASASAATVVNLDDIADEYAVTDYAYIFAAETGSSYHIELIVKDDFGSAAKTTSASTAFTLMHWLASGFGMAIGKISELAHVLDIGFQTRFSGGILHPVLKAETDLNDVRTPNTYVGANVSTNNYANCPIEAGTFTLAVEGAGEEGQVKQRLTSCRKVDARTFERFYYQGEWGEWVCTSDYAGTLLWSGEYYMTQTHTATLSEPVSKQKNGIVLVFSGYNPDSGAAINNSFHSFFIPKMFVSTHAGARSCFQMSTADLAYYCVKQLTIADDRIVGVAGNNATGTGTSKITYANNRFVLRYVIGV